MMRPPPQQHEVEQQFTDAMMQAGYNPGHIDASTTGFTRFDAPGDKPGRRNAYYRLAFGKYPVGWFGDWKTGEQVQWNFYGDDRSLTDAEKKEIAREQRRLKMEAEQEREAKQAEVAEDASKLWREAQQTVDTHPYLERKQIAIPRGMRLHRANDGTQLLVVPMWSFDLNGSPRLTSLQMIDPAGSKRFLKGGRVDGTFFSLPGDKSIIIICEGVATAFSIWQATGLSVVAAFNSGNLRAVAKDFKRWRPQAALAIAADNDAIAPDDWADRGSGRPWKNAGVLAAQKAGEAIECRWIIPVFEGGERRGWTDFNDLHLIEGDDAVKRQIGAIWKAIDTAPDEIEPDQPAVTFENIQDEAWRSAVPRTAQGSLDGGNVRGVQIFLQEHKLLRSRLRYNQLSKAVEVDGNELEDIHVTEMRRIMHAASFKSRKTDVEDEMNAEAQRNQYDPLRDFLAGCKWDGKPRVAQWLARYLNAPDTPYTRTIGRKFLIGMVARGLAPGCKFDTMIVLEGAQGIGKSTALRYLVGDQFFTDHLPDFSSKDAFQQLQGIWLVEVGELAAMSKAEVADVKLFLSRTIDKFRPPYAKAPITVPRRTGFGGSVNPEDNGYLRDPTGARRFWPVQCGEINLPALLRDREQLWGEAVTLFTAGEVWHLTEDEEIRAAEIEQAARRERDAWEPVIGMWIKREVLTTVTVSGVLGEAVKMPPERWTSALTRRVASSLRALGWRSDGGAEDAGQTFYAPGHHPDDDYVAFDRIG